MKALTTVLVLAGALGAPITALAVTATFDDLLTAPALDGSTGLFFANGGSSVYAGVTWDSRFTVVGDQYRTQPGSAAPFAPQGPLFGIPNSGHYFVSNESAIVDGGTVATNDGLTITTSKVLTGAYFGRNEYYGFGGGADQITITALHGGTASVDSVTFDLPELRHSAPGFAGFIGSGEPEFLSFADTSAFTSLTGITGYRIDRRELGTQSGNWVADDFTFVAAAPVPEPETFAMLLAGLGLVVWVGRPRRLL